MDPAVLAMIEKFIKDNCREDADGFYYRSADGKTLYCQFTAHVDAVGVYHNTGVPSGGKLSCSYDYFMKNQPDGVKGETFESCCCQMCYCATTLCDKHHLLVNIAHDDTNTSEYSRKVKIKCIDKQCPARALHSTPSCPKGPLARDILTDQAAAAEAAVPYLFCAHDGDRPSQACARGVCVNCGWGKKIPRCKAIENHPKIEFSVAGPDGRLEWMKKSGAQFYEYAEKYFEKWLPHIHTCIHQRDVLHQVYDEEKKDKSGKTIISQIDFSEAARHERNHGPTAEQADSSTLLLSENSFYCHELGRMTTETGASISSDQKKDATHTHALLRAVWDRYKSRRFGAWVIVSDGGPAHFKNKDALALAAHLRSYCGVPVMLIFHQGNHGKSVYDPEGGIIKAAARHKNQYDRFQSDPIKNTQTFFDFCNGSQELQNPKPGAKSKRSGTFSSHYCNDDTRFAISKRWFIHLKDIDRRNHDVQMRVAADHTESFSSRGTTGDDNARFDPSLTPL